MMDHDLVVKNYTAERYALGELTETERDAYEEHYFDCTLCAEDVLYSSEFMLYAREAMADTKEVGLTEGPVRAWPNKVPDKFWFRPMATAACGLLALGLSVGIFQNFRARRALEDKESAQIVSSNYTVALTAGRSLEESQVPANENVRLRFIVPPSSYKAYRSVVVGRSGEEKFPLIIKAEDTNSAVELRLAKWSLQPGDYMVVVNGIKEDSTLDKDKEREARFPFRVVDRIVPKN